MAEPAIVLPDFSLAKTFQYCSIDGNFYHHLEMLMSSILSDCHASGWRGEQMVGIVVA